RCMAYPEAAVDQVHAATTHRRCVVAERRLLDVDDRVDCIQTATVLPGLIPENPTLFADHDYPAVLGMDAATVVAGGAESIVAADADIAIENDQLRVEQSHGAAIDRRTTIDTGVVEQYQ